MREREIYISDFTATIYTLGVSIRMIVKLEMSLFFSLFGDYVHSFDESKTMNIKIRRTMCPVS